LDSEETDGTFFLAAEAAMAGVLLDGEETDSTFFLEAAAADTSITLVLVPLLMDMPSSMETLLISLSQLAKSDQETP